MTLINLIKFWFKLIILNLNNHIIFIKIICLFFSQLLPVRYIFNLVIVIENALFTVYTYVVCVFEIPRFRLKYPSPQLYL